MVGDSNVGKTSVVLRYTKNIFHDEFLNSIGVDFKSKDINIAGKKIKLQIWDTAGQEKFRTITTSYYRGAHAIAIVFDLTKRETYEHVKRWLNDINRFAKENVLKFLIGNKSDLVNERQVKYEEARLFAYQMKAMYFDVSAKKNENINEFFEAATKVFIIKYNNFFDMEENKKIVLNKKEVKDKDNNKKKAKKKEDNC